ncbi:bifunctional PIG-L family deacetylase/class I SAM-dependent methyltransferase [Jiella pacifica]|uniref:Methyltransferase domain-containing protein n=1 Tax=Jiella pacifica TaxID=2696469 RepID=A0A6N9T8V6_9HYPH|nr:bifunctional PIG-L family deacetylase/class I SAM-dependent methyltransferase [Jiella pacifica]NDW05328.1 methyltransferase domain-containing protein [Jiella pacifica]
MADTSPKTRPEARAETWGAFRARCEAAPLTDAARLVGEGGLVVLAPHPDDETFGASALLLEAARSGRAVGIVALTDGDASHPNSQAVSRAQLAEIRRGEQEEAVATFGVADARWLRLGLPDSAAGRSAGFAAAAEKIAAFCDEMSATTLCAPHPDDPHIDHQAAAVLAETVLRLRPALRLLFYPIWSMRLGDGEPYRSNGLLPFRIATDPEMKARATACHRSQLGEVIEDDPSGFALPDWFLEAQGEPTEVYVWAKKPGLPPGPDHFAALYADDGDPWQAQNSPYEVEKRADNIDQLARSHYREGLDIGCGEGHLAAELIAAGKVDAMAGLDRDPSIVARAERRYGDDARLHFRAGALPEDLPEGRFDCVIVSEILYFLDEAAIAALALRLADRLAPGADILIVSYLGPTDTPLSGREAHDLFVACLGEACRTISCRRRERYVAELLRFVPEGAARMEGDGTTR